mmetsp:Transcript_50796/g.135518  ORF Transcript_50796/g.135518 Transcript_50796/m.135518 type:complete len:212 (-) Transcript_50796:154-789(-)
MMYLCKSEEQLHCPHGCRALRGMMMRKSVHMAKKIRVTQFHAQEHLTVLLPSIEKFNHSTALHTAPQGINFVHDQVFNASTGEELPLHDLEGELLPRVSLGDLVDLRKGANAKGNIVRLKTLLQRRRQDGFQQFGIPFRKNRRPLLVEDEPGASRRSWRGARDRPEMKSGQRRVWRLGGRVGRVTTLNFAWHQIPEIWTLAICIRRGKTQL